MNNNVPKSLLLFAKTLLDTDDAEFEPVLSDWTELDFREFCLRHADLIEESCGWSREQADSEPVENWSLHEDDVDLTWLFLDFACSKKRLVITDWPGESEHGEIAAEVDRMLQEQWNSRLEWNSEAYYDSLDEGRLHRGDHPLILFKSLDNSLKRIGFRLVIFNIGGDCYHYGVLPKDRFDQVNGLHWDHYGVDDADARCRESNDIAWISYILSFFGVQKPYVRQVYDRLRREEAETCG